MKTLWLATAALTTLTFSAANAQQKTKKVVKKTTVTKTVVSKQPATKAPVASSAGWLKTANGLQYKITNRGAGTYSPKIGDMAEIHVKFKIGDSTIINSVDMNEGKPVPHVFQASQFKGDLNEGLLMMKQGDEATFRMLVDTLSKRSSQPKPSWSKRGDYATWDVKMVTVKNKSQYEQEQQAIVQEQAMKDEALIKAHLAAKGVQAQRTASGLYYIIHQEGNGEQAQAGKKMVMNYTGMLLDGSKFDSNVDPAFGHVSPFEFDLGARQVIAGWDEGIALLKKGGKATLYIPSGLAYGTRSMGPKIPANSVLAFDVELVDIK